MDTSLEMANAVGHLELPDFPYCDGFANTGEVIPH